MALPPFVDPNEKEWLYKVTNKTSSNPERDICLLNVFFLTPCTTLEINRIQIRDILYKPGTIKLEFNIRGALAFNGLERTIYLSNKKLRQHIKDYVDYRIKHKIGLGDHPDLWGGLDPNEPLFFTNKSAGFSIIKKTSPKGAVSYHSDALNRHIKELMRKSGIENPSILSGRRTFAVMLKRKGIDVSYIHYLLGNKSLKTTQKLFISDPVDMAAIAADVF